MPQGRKELRDKFMVDGQDGIATCEDIITDAGGTMHRGVITLPPKDSFDTEVLEAIEYLVTEWDYSSQVSTW